jgi:predicted permease
MARFFALVRNLLRKPGVERELDDEVRAFVDLQTDENLARGMSAADARRAALLACGGVEQVKESVREVRAGAYLEQFVQDIRFGARMLKKNPGFAAVAILTIALGIGANASIFAVFNSAVLRPLALPEPQRVVSLYQTLHGEYSRTSEGEGGLFSYPEYLAYREGNEVFSGLAAYTPGIRATLDGDQQEITGQLTSCNYFDVVGVQPAMGRGFLADECAAQGSGPVVVIADRMWRETFKADPAILGKAIRVNRTALTVIGVAAPDFDGTELVPPRFWAPVSNQRALMKRTQDADLLQEPDWGWLTALGRLKDGVSLPKARSNLEVIAAGIDARSPGRRSVLTMDTATYLGRPDMRVVVMGVGAVVLTAAGLVLLIACANLANLMLARAAARSRETAVRLAMGASRGRLVRQLLTESLMIAIVGGALGLAISSATEEVLVKTVIAQLPESDAPRLDVAPDMRVFLYALGLTLFTGFAFGLAPALQASKADVNVALKQDAALPEPRRAWMRGTLMGAQVAMCMVLLVAAGLLLRGLYHAQTVDPGYDMAHHAAVNFDPQQEGYSLAQATKLNRELAERLQALPGVEGVTPVFAAPLARHRSIAPFGAAGESRLLQMDFNVVGRGFFSSLAIPLVRGRDFSETEIANDAEVVIVNEGAARQLWPGEDPIGKRVRAVFPTERQLEVIGVARDVDLSELGQRHAPYLYLPATPAQQREIRALLVRTNGDARAALGMVRTAAGSVDPTIKIEVGTLRGNLEAQAESSWMVVVLAAALGGLGLLLAAIGIYGTVSYAVTRRVREIGIRMTLGATGRDVLRVILRRAMRPVAAGAAIGMVASAGVGRILQSMLFGLSPLDAVAYVSVAAFLLSVAMLASYLPARRALRVDPMTAIRHE